MNTGVLLICAMFQTATMVMVHAQGVYNGEGLGLQARYTPEHWIDKGKEGGYEVSEAAVESAEDVRAVFRLKQESNGELLNIVNQTPAAEIQQLRLIDEGAREVSVPFNFVDEGVSVDMSAVPAGYYKLQLVSAPDNRVFEWNISR